MKKMLLSLAILGFATISNAGVEGNLRPVYLQTQSSSQCMVGSNLVVLVSSQRTDTYTATVRITNKPVIYPTTIVNKDYVVKPLAIIPLGCSKDMNSTYSYEVINYYKM